jgi:hypothetical protein
LAALDRGKLLDSASVRAAMERAFEAERAFIEAVVGLSAQ